MTPSFTTKRIALKSKDHLDALLSAALHLSKVVSSKRKYENILDAVFQVLPSDAGAILKMTKEGLKPISIRGLSKDVLGRRFKIKEHPRFQAIVDSGPLVFASDDPRPDPYDGMILGSDSLEIHSCIGAPLMDGDEMIGLLTLDSLKKNQYIKTDLRLFAAFAALVAAALRTASLVEQLEWTVKRVDKVNAELVKEALEKEGKHLLGESKAMISLREEITTVAYSNLSVLITGETGTGKELVARMLHAKSRRAKRPLVYINCAALPENLAESELFGHIRGAFTGAISQRMGKFEFANKGTLFLDEIGELPLSIQAKLLRTLQFGEIQRVGAEKTRTVDVRIIAATNRNIEKEVLEGRFRADLYHRLSVFPIHILPLRERREDIPLLLGHCAEKAKIQLGIGDIRIAQKAINSAVEYDWPGNVRELDHIITRAALRASVRCRSCPITITSELLNLVPKKHKNTDQYETLSFRKAVEAFKHDRVKRALSLSENNWSAAARALELDRGNFFRLATRLGFKRK